MHDESHNFIVVIKIRGSKLNVAVVYYRINITIFIKFEVSLEINIKVLENEFNFTFTWEDVGIDLLHGIDFPTFDSREVKFNER